MSGKMSESEFGKRTVSFNEIVQQECKYSCWLGPAKERGKKPDRTQEFVSIDVLDDARKEFPIPEWKQEVIFSVTTKFTEAFTTDECQRLIKWFWNYFGSAGKK